MRWIDHTAVRAQPHLQIIEMTPPGPNRAGAWAEHGTWHGLQARLRLTFTPTDNGTRTLLRANLRLTSTRPWLPARLVLHALAPPAIRADLHRAAHILNAGE